MREENETLREDQRVLEEQVPGLQSDLSRREEQLRDAKLRLTQADEAKVGFGCCDISLHRKLEFTATALLIITFYSTVFITYLYIITGAGGDGALRTQTASDRPAGGEREIAA